MKIIIDRFEGDFAVVEISAGDFANMPKTLVPSGTKEGDVLSIEIDKGETERRKKEIDDLMNNLFK
ncbi:MAG: DUF3006 domain-containing protein [Bacillota bacterium]|nr:DUF3006 domain-containing protein [Bacillota bacterium]